MVTRGLVIDRLTVARDGRRLLDRVSLRVLPGQRLAIVGESGSGKSLLASTILRILRPPVRVTEGTIAVDGLDLLSLDAGAMRQHRGLTVFLVFQSHGPVLNPCLSVFTQVVRAAARRAPADARERTAAAFTMLGLPADAARRYPFEISGGMRQRVMIAMALVMEPRILIADEPTTGLDPLTQRDVLRAIDVMMTRTGASVLLVTHDLRAAGVLCRDAIVLHQGRVVAEGPLSSFGGDGWPPAARALAQAAARTE
jgi:ABC-type glutathione transport system ATPase component